MAVAQVLCYVACAIYLSSLYYKRDSRGKSATSSKGSKRNASKDAEFKKVIESVRKATGSVAEAIREENAITERSQAHIYSAGVSTELKNVGFEKKTLYQAHIVLMADAVKVRAFFGCPVEERKNFLLF